MKWPEEVDTLLGCPGPVSGLERGRGQIPQRRMQPLPVLEEFDVFEHPPMRLLARGSEPMQAQLALEGAEEALFGGDVPVVALAGHARDRLLSLQRGLVVHRKRTGPRGRTRGPHPGAIRAESKRPDHRQLLPVDWRSQHRRLASGRPAAPHTGLLSEPASVRVDNPRSLPAGSPVLRASVGDASGLRHLHLAPSPAVPAAGDSSLSAPTDEPERVANELAEGTEDASSNEQEARNGTHQRQDTVCSRRNEMPRECPDRIGGEHRQRQKPI